VFDPVRDRWVLFSGAAFFQYDNYTYSLALGDDPTWSFVGPAGVVPGAREGAAAIYDWRRDRMVIFGGWDGASTYKSDVRALALASPEWSFVTVAGTPPSPRSESSAIYDGARDRLVLFGGRDSATTNNEVWTVNFDGPSTWTHLATTGTPPSARYAAGAVYDSIGDRMIVYGGTTTSSVMTDTWSLTLATGAWTRLDDGSNAPPARKWFGSALDSRRRRMLVFGGQYEFRDIWALSLDDPTHWVLVDPGSAPEIRSRETLVADPTRDRLIELGAPDAHPWVLDFGEDRWQQLQPAGSAPAPRSDHTAMLDGPRSRMIVCAGSNGGAILSDLWSLTFEPLEWSPIVTSGPSPGARTGHSAVYDAARQRMLLFGGGSDADVYALDLVTSAWTRISPSGGPGSRSSHAAIYDPVRDRMLIVGGYPSGSADVWALSLSGTPAWTQLAPSGAGPGPGSPWRGAYDPVLDRMLIYGGDYDRYAQSVGFALSLSGTPTWAQLAASPASNYGGSQIAFDPLRDRLLMHGGTHVTGLGSFSANTQTYELSFAATLPAPEPLPIPRTRIASVRPNPGRDVQTIQLEIAPGEPASSLEILSVGGQRVWSERLSGTSSGARAVRWSGTDAAGRLCPPGVYWAALHTQSGTRVVRFVRLR